mmetsp:Transcript_12894/g.27354  ORF Transcript_12894/g.27354 Transcript_12894/m.27354 type:complete len:481 (+) Transcript_12894:3-1445(+)
MSTRFPCTGSSRSCRHVSQQAHPRRRRREGEAGAHPRRLQRAAGQDRCDHQSAADRGGDPHDQARLRQGRLLRHPHVAPRPPRRQEEPLDDAQACGGEAERADGQAGDLRSAVRRRGGGGGVQGASAGLDHPPREPPLPRGGGGQGHRPRGRLPRREVREEGAVQRRGVQEDQGVRGGGRRLPRLARQDGRRLRQRRLRHRAPRPLLDGRHGGEDAVRRRTARRKGTRRIRAGARPGQGAASADRDRRRRQDLRQDPRHREPDREVGPRDVHRRHGVHLPQGGVRHEHWQLTLRQERRGARAQADGEGQGEGVRAHLPVRLAVRAGVQERPADPAGHARVWHPRRVGGHGLRAGVDEALPREDPLLQDRHLERPGRRLRVRHLLQGHQGCARGGGGDHRGGQQRHHWRRRLRHRRRQVQHGGQGHLRLHRRRRVARAARGEASPRHRGARRDHRAPQERRGLWRLQGGGHVPRRLRPEGA